MLAQSLLEYGAIQSAMSSIGNAIDSAGIWIQDQNPMVLLAVGIVIIIIVFSAFRGRG